MAINTVLTERNRFYNLPEIPADTVIYITNGMHTGDTVYINYKGKHVIRLRTFLSMVHLEWINNRWTKVVGRLNVDRTVTYTKTPLY